jgi:putative transposase
VLSIKSECLNRMMFFGETGLRQAATSYIEHYHAGRPHQGIGNVIIEDRTTASDGVVQCTERLGGLIKHYHRAA